MDQDTSFSKWRQILWPIHGHELVKLLPMLLLGFLICFNYSLLRNVKDALIVTQKDSGAEIIPFLKVWGILPGAIFITSCYTWLTRRMSHQKTTLIMIGSFVLFYNIFAFFLFPMRGVLHPHALADQMASQLPNGFFSVIAMFRYWTLTLFYIGAELWSTMILSVLFWGFANEITKLHEAKRFYAIIGVGSSLATFAAGQAGMRLSLPRFLPWLPFGSDKVEQSLMILTTLVTISGVLSMALYYYISERNRTDPLFQGDPEHQCSNKKAKRTFSVGQSFLHLSRSPYLRDVAIMVIGYNLVINLCEVIWKSQIRELYPDATDYNRFTSSVTSAIGILAAMAAITVPGIIRRRGWTFTALVTPVLLLGTSVVFFSLFFMPTSMLTGVSGFISASPLFLIVMTGAVQNALCRSSKYSIFDVTKEMTFIPLNHESRLKGKAAIDGVGSRFGKSGGSVIQQVLIMSFGSLAVATPFIATIIGIVIAAWLIATLRLGRRFKRLSEHPEAEEAGVELRSDFIQQRETTHAATQAVSVGSSSGTSSLQGTAES